MLPDFLMRPYVSLIGRAWDRRSAGILGEQTAERHLRRQGLRFVTRNWRNPQDRREEIDLVFRDREVLVFVEVRTRQQDALVSGAWTLGQKKKAALRRAVQAYLRFLRHDLNTWRLDVVEVELANGKVAEVLHHENFGLTG